MSFRDAAAVLSVVMFVAGVVWFFVAPAPATVLKIYVIPLVLMGQLGVVWGVLQERSLRKALLYVGYTVLTMLPLFGILEATARSSRRRSSRRRPTTDDETEKHQAG